MATIGAYLMAGCNTAQRVSFYFAAHGDDWQLFMNPSAFRDVIDGNTKSVFIPYGQKIKTVRKSSSYLMRAWSRRASSATFF